MADLAELLTAISATLRDIAERLEASTDADPRFHVDLPDDADLPDEIREQADRIDIVARPITVHRA